MGYHPDLHHRRSIRLKNYDYSRAGAYFITICVQNRECSLGEIQEGHMVPSPIGHLVQNSWQSLPQRFPSLELDEFALMPNHIHGILILTDENTEKHPKISEIIAYWKYTTTKTINHDLGSPGVRFWQRNYYEHIIRNYDSLQYLRQYILENPLKWHIDQLHPANPSHW